MSGSGDASHSGDASYTVTIPAGVKPGMTVKCVTPAGDFGIVCPAGVVPGQKLSVHVPARALVQQCKTLVTSGCIRDIWSGGKSRWSDGGPVVQIIGAKEIQTAMRDAQNDPGSSTVLLRHCASTTAAV